MSRISSFYTLVTHIEKIADGTSVYCIECPIVGTEYCHKLNPRRKGTLAMKKK